MEEIRTTADGKHVLVIAGLSDVGCVRTNNEDSFGFFHDENPAHGCLLVVADGMGGAAGGEVASRVAVETIRDAFYGHTNGSRRSALLDSIHLANQAIFEQAADEPQLEGMGTTCTAAYVSGLDLIIGHVGDSRAYVLSNKELAQVTLDHSLAAELERRAAPGEPAPVAGRNVLTRCLGVAPEVRVDVSEEPIELAPGDSIIMCSDGLSNMVTGDEIRDTVSLNSPDLACRKLVDLARERGGPDNITVQIARVTQ